MFNKKIQFQVMGEAGDKNRIRQKIKSLILKNFGVKIPVSEFTFNLKNYYMLDGRKITKPLKSLISIKGVDSEILNSKFPEFSNQVSQLYLPSYTLECFWGDKFFIGEGLYEKTKTCFRAGGENFISKKFIMNSPRVQVLVLRTVSGVDTEHEKVARCLVYFAGGRSIYLTNFYWKGMNCNSLLFVEALRRMLNLEKVTWKNECVDLLIYLNGDGILITTNRTHNYTRPRKFGCPHCGYLTLESVLHKQSCGNYKHVKCSSGCYSDDPCCKICGSEDSSFTIMGNKELICGACVNRVSVCEACGDIELSENCIDEVCRACYNAGVHECDENHVAFA